MRRILTPNGRSIMAGAPKQMTAVITRLLTASSRSLFARQKFRFFIADLDRDDLTALATLMKDGKVTPAIDRRYPLSEAANAIGYVEEGHARAKVVITVR
jgi:NADPH:quinone reductase-like Zn-dependent oxidoreductase